MSSRTSHSAVLFILAIVFVQVLALRSLQAQDSSATRQGIRFADQIGAFLKEDKVNPPPKHSILFIGSSIFRQWAHLKEQMAPLPVFNRAFGGSRTEEVLAQMDRLVFPYEPRIIVYYCGSNDVNAGAKAFDIFLHFKEFCDRAAEKLPNTKVFFVSINRAPQKMNKWDVVDSANAMAKAYCGTSVHRAFIDVNPALFDKEGKPRLELYRDDKLHFKDPAYEEFAAIIKPVLLESWQQKGTNRPHLVGLSHAAFLVHDVEKARAFYKSFLGFDEPFSLTKTDGSLDLTYIKINDRQSIELFTERAETSGRLYQIAFEVDDAEAMRAYLASQGIKTPEKVNKGRIGNLNFSVKDPDGHTVEFVQYLPEGWTLRDAGKHLSADPLSSHLKHVGFIVDSLDRTMRFYRDILGCQETWRGNAPGQLLQWVNLKVPDGDDYIELMLYTDQPSAMRLGSMNHISLEVPDVTKTAATLAARPWNKEYGRPLTVRTGINRKRQLNVFDPDSTRTEFMEPKTVDGLLVPSSTAKPPR
jgi:catechol 2,3-dioxygenase-like lactoylglutathione lyase family enzyme/lysophospholipase L1-like esterase